MIIILLLAVQNQIPIGQFRPETVLRESWLLAGVAVLFVAHNAFAGQPSPVPAVVNQYCVGCHDREVKKGGLDLENIRLEDATQHPDEWERVIRKLRARQMPPTGKDRPDERTYEAVLSQLASTLDRAAAKHPNPGRTETFRRLNRTEYQNAIRDLLGV